MHSNPTAVEVAGKLLFDIKQDHAAPRDWAERLGKVVQLIHEERVAELTEEIEHLQDSLIRQGKMLSAIVNITKGPPEENTLHSTHDAVESVERLQARVAELYDLIKYAQVDSGVCMCGDDIKDHNQSSGHSPVDVWDHAVEQVDKGGTSEALILRKQAEAVQASRQGVEGEPVAWWDGDMSAAEDSFSFKSNGYYTIPLYTHPAKEAKGRIADPALEGEPIGYVVPRMLKAMQAGKYCGISISDEKKDGDIAVYTHPASAQAPEEIERDGINSTENLAYIDGYNDCAKEVRENARSNKQAVSVPKQWVDLMRELVKDLISEIKTKQKLKPDERVAEDLGAVREAIALIAKQEKGE